MMAIWRALYEELAQFDAPLDAAQRFLDQVCSEAQDQAAPCRYMAKIGRVLSVDVEQLQTIKLVQDKASYKRGATVLVLQSICRFLQLCQKKKKKETKALKKELRVLLDRLALQLDAANPPSLTDEDEHSPFQLFLQRVIGEPLQRFIPDVIKHFNRVYEFEDEEDACPVMPVQSPPPVPLTSSPTGKTESRSSSPVATSVKRQSIVSVLREERPSKRPRPETEDRFMEVVLPEQFQKRKSTRKSLSSKPEATTTTSSKSSKLLSLLPSPLPLKTPDTRMRPFNRSAPSLSRRAFEPGSSLREKPMMRGNRQLVIAQTPERPTRAAVVRASAGSQSTGGPRVIKGTPDKSQQLRPRRPETAVRAVVLRTPDRPARSTHLAPTTQRSNTRVLVLSSPPLHQNTAPRPRVRHPPSLPSHALR